MARGKHYTAKQPTDKTYSPQWSGVSYAPEARGVHCPKCGGHLHKEAGEHYCPRCDDYVRAEQGRPIE